jgi:hypothetical protein
MHEEDIVDLPELDSEQQLEDALCIIEESLPDSAVLFLSNAIDPEREDTRTGAILDYLAEAYGTMDLPIFGVCPHSGPHGSCSHTVGSQETHRRVLSRHTEFLGKKLNSGTLFTLGNEAKATVAGVLAAPVPHLPYPSVWLTRSHVDDVHTLLQNAIPSLEGLAAFRESLKAKHVTQKGRHASETTMRWVKHLPASSKQKAAASMTGSVTIHRIKHLPATAATRRAAADNGRSQKSRAACKKMGDTVGKQNLLDAKAKPDFRKKWKEDTDQTSPEKLSVYFAKNGSVDLLTASHAFAKQPGHFLEKLNKAVAATTLTAEFVAGLPVGSSSPENVDRQRAWELYETHCLTLWQCAFLNPTPVTAGDVRTAFGMTEAQRRVYETAHPRVARAEIPEATYKAVASLIDVPLQRQAATLVVNGKSAGDLLELLGLERVIFRRTGRPESTRDE